MVEVNYQAKPIHSPKRHSRISLDPRLASDLSRINSMPSETREALIQHTVTSKWQPDSRAVYAAVVDGFTTEGELETVTGMPLPRIKTAVAFLEGIGVLRKVV